MFMGLVTYSFAEVRNNNHLQQLTYKYREKSTRVPTATAKLPPNSISSCRSYVIVQGFCGGP